MHVEIRNTHWKNQGAQLMLRAVVDRLRRESDDWSFAVAGRCATPETRNELGLDRLPWVQGWGTQADCLARLLPPLHPKGWVRASDIHVVLDASGFAYGDSWGPEKAQMAAAYYRRVKKRGGRIILLPQALGPFENDALRTAFCEVIELADRVYARDATSLAAVHDLGGEQSHVRQSYDFTHTMTGLAPDSTLAPRTVGLIPNRKMLDMGAAKRDEYVSLFTRAIRIVMERDCTPLILIHSAEDRTLADAIVQSSPHPTDVIEEAHPLRVKGLIGQCHAVLSSRFHGLVNALSAAVPAIATGWSHKYQHVLEDFGCPDMLLRADVDDEGLTRTLSALLDEPRRSDTIAGLREATRGQNEYTEAMWRDVLACMGG